MYRVGFKWSHDDLGLVITTTFGSRRAPDTSLRPAGRRDPRAVMEIHGDPPVVVATGPSGRGDA